MKEHVYELVGNLYPAQYFHYHLNVSLDLPRIFGRFNFFSENP